MSWNIYLICTGLRQGLQLQEECSKLICGPIFSCKIRSFPFRMESLHRVLELGICLISQTACIQLLTMLTLFYNQADGWTFLVMRLRLLIRNSFVSAVMDFILESLPETLRLVKIILRKVWTQKVNDSSVISARLRPGDTQSHR